MTTVDKMQNDIITRPPYRNPYDMLPMAQSGKHLDMLRTDSELNNIEYGSEDYDTDLEAQGRLLCFILIFYFYLIFTDNHLVPTWHTFFYIEQGVAD